MRSRFKTETHNGTVVCPIANRKVVSSALPKPTQRRTLGRREAVGKAESGGRVSNLGLRERSTLRLGE